jgi:hypothetical protein
MFDYDWFAGRAFEQQQAEAVQRCLAVHFPHLSTEQIMEDPDACKFADELEVRRIIYLRDGVCYEVKAIADVNSKSHLTFECEPADEHYKVGAFVVAVPFEDIARVEVFAVHPSEKPDDMPAITGFKGKPERKHGRDSRHDRRSSAGGDERT